VRQVARAHGRLFIFGKNRVNAEVKERLSSALSVADLRTLRTGL